MYLEQRERRRKTMKSTFEVLNAINCNEHTEKKNGLTYLSWAWAWSEVKKAFPDATYTVYENTDGWNYFTDGRTAWVKTGVTIQGLEHIEYLPVMDYKNKSIPLEQITSFDVNKSIQRSLTKACARHGLGLYIYAGEDLPEGYVQNEEIENGTYRSWLDNALIGHEELKQQILEKYKVKSTDQLDSVLSKEQLDVLLTWLKGKLK